MTHPVGLHIPRIYSSFIVKAARNLPSAARYFDRYEWIFRGLPRPRIGPLLTSAQWGRRGGDRNALRVTDKSYAIRATGCYRRRDDDRATDLFSRNFAGNLYGGVYRRISGMEIERDREEHVPSLSIVLAANFDGSAYS